MAIGTAVERDVGVGSLGAEAQIVKQRVRDEDARVGSLDVEASVVRRRGVELAVLAHAAASPNTATALMLPGGTQDTS